MQGERERERVDSHIQLMVIFYGCSDPLALPVSVCLSVCLSVCVGMHMCAVSVCLLYVCLYILLSVGVTSLRLSVCLQCVCVCGILVVHPLIYTSIFPLHTPAIIKVFRVVSWPDLPSICLLKVRNIYPSPIPRYPNLHSPVLRHTLTHSQACHWSSVAHSA